MLGTIPTALFAQSTSGGGGYVECIGVDFSAAGAGKTLVSDIGGNTSGITFLFIDCKLHASVIKSSVPAGSGTAQIDFIRSGASGVNYTVHRQRYSGLLVEEVSVVRIDGASDGVTPIAWRIDITANCNYSLPFDCPPIAVWNDTPGVPVTATVEGIWQGGALPLDTDIWVEYEYLGDASSPLGSFVADCAANLLTATVSQDGSSAAWSIPGTAFDGASNLVVLSNNNLTVTHNNTTINAGAISTAYNAAGKYDFEVKVEATTTTTNAAGVMSSDFNGVFSTSSLTVNAHATAVQFAGPATGTSIIWSNALSTGIDLGFTPVGTVYCFAIDLTARLAWVRRNNENWNANASANPATGVGGVAMAPGYNFAPIVRFQSSATTTDAMTGNFGTSPYVHPIPAGFGNWPPAWSFKLNATFTPQQAGWIYARVKVGRASSTFYIDPKVELS